MTIGFRPGAGRRGSAWFTRPLSAESGRFSRWGGIQEMRKLVSIILLLWLASLSAAAQDFPKAEIFGGYQLTRLDGTTLNGWNAALTGNLNHWFGVTGDFSGAYTSQGGVDFRNYTYTFGPTISARGNETFTPFAHALFGGSHASAGFGGVSASDNPSGLISAAAWMPSSHPTCPFAWRSLTGCRSAPTEARRITISGTPLESCFTLSPRQSNAEKEGGTAPPSILCRGFSTYRITGLYSPITFTITRLSR